MEEAQRGQVERALRPRGVAVVGASRTPSMISTMLHNIRDYGFEGNYCAVNPRYPDIDGIPCYPSLLDVPFDIDHVLVAVPNRIVPTVLAEAEQRQVGVVNIITSGYAETDDGHTRQQELAAWRRRTGIRVIGPNCLGLMVYPARFNATIYRYQHLQPGRCGFILQSGQMAQAIIVPCLDRRIGVNYVVTCGNEADLQTVDFLEYMLEDPDIRVVGCFTEQVRSPERLMALAERAADLNKRIVMLKIGRTEASQRSTQAHTGALAGSDVIFDAVAARHGITRVRSIEDLVETVAVMHSPRLPRGGGVGTILVSGGAVGLMSDLAGDHGIEFPPLPAETVARLRPILPEFGPIGNPLDVTAQASRMPGTISGAIQELAALDSIDVVVYGFRGVPSFADGQTEPYQALRQAIEQHPDKVFLVMSLAGGTFHDGQMSLQGQPVAEPIAELGGIPFLDGGMDVALGAIRALIDHAAFHRLRAARLAAGPAPRLVPESAAAEARAIVARAGGRPLTEREGKALLRLYGIGCTEERLAATTEQAVTAARAIGYPVVLKIESAQITHKTEAGGVRLGVAGDAAVAEAFEAIVASARRYNPEAEIAGVLVQEQVAGGHELILGATRDPVYGPTVLCGLGGIFVELLKDTALRLAPVDQAEARGMVESLRGQAILRGMRGQAPADIDALVDALQRFGELAADLGDVIDEVDVNPLLVFEAGQGVKALDCLVIPRGAQA